MEKRIVVSLLVIAAFLLARQGHFLLKLFDSYQSAEVEIRRAVYLLWWYIAFPLLVLGLLHGIRKIASEAGVATRFKAGIRTGFLGALPMLLGAGALVGFQFRWDWEGILLGCLLAAVGEEILYRGLLFGQLFRHAGWGFLLAGMASAVIFGAGHLYQGNEVGTMAGIFLVTFMGGLWFSWLYVEWGYNLWVPMSFHFFMNLSWTLFDVSDNALGSWPPNVFRAATIVLSIVLTIRHKRLSGEEWVVKGPRWWRGSVLAACFFIMPFFVFGQNEKVLGGTVTDEQGHAMPYVNIGIVGTSIGTVSGMDGSFQIYLPATVDAADTLRFSMVGHEARVFSVGDFEKTFGKYATVALPHAAGQLPEVVVRPGLSRTKRIGMDRPGTRMAVNFAISDQPNQNLGAEIGRKFNLPKGEIRLDTFRFYVARNNFDTVRLRINGYQLEKGRPGTPLFRQNIVLELSPRQSGWITLDLTPYQIAVKGDVVLGVEWVYHGGKGKSLALPIAVPSGGVHFYKYGSQGNWKKFAGMSAAMELDVSY